MNDWWIDTEPYAGPDRSYTFEELWCYTRDSLQPIIDVVKSMYTPVLPRRPTPGLSWSDEASDPMEDLKKFQEGFALITDVTKEESEGIVKSLQGYTDAVNHIEKKKEGQGIVKNHGPRSQRTFTRNGRKRY